MRIKIILVLFVLSIGSYAFATPCNFSTLGADSWCIEDQIRETVYTSQSAPAYDSYNNRINTFNGHLPGGSYPQPTDMMQYDISTRTWTSVRPLDSDNPPSS